MNVLKRDWAPDMGLRHVLVIVRCLLIEPFPESALNEEAGKLLLENYEDFAKHARLMTSIHAQSSKRCGSLLSSSPWMHSSSSLLRASSAPLQGFLCTALAMLQAHSAEPESIALLPCSKAASMTACRQAVCAVLVDAQLQPVVASGRSLIRQACCRRPMPLTASGGANALNAQDEAGGEKEGTPADGALPAVKKPKGVEKSKAQLAKKKALRRL